VLEQERGVDDLYVLSFMPVGGGVMSTSFLGMQTRSTGMVFVF